MSQRTTTPRVWVEPDSLHAELTARAESVETELERLLAVSKVDRRFGRGSGIITTQPWEWARLDDEHLEVLAQAREVVQQWLEAGRRLVRLCAPEFAQDFDDHADVLTDVVDRSNRGAGPSNSDPVGVLEDVREALTAQREVLRHTGVFTAKPRELLLVPDTSALYSNPALEDWATQQFATLVLVPQVIREIDRHKVHHPAEEVRKKAGSLIRRFEELGRRGNTFAGIKLANKLSFREVALDPDPSELVDGLRLENDDDRILASALELKWRTPSAAVVLVTADRNLLNKARMTQLATDAPPPSSRPAPTSRGRRTRTPEVSIGHAGGQMSTTPLGDLREGEKSRLIRVEPRYPIENKGATGIWNVTTGVRTRDGRRHIFEGYKAQLIGAGETSWVENVGSIPAGLLEGTHQSAAFDAFLYWTRFTDADGVLWEALYDAETRTTSYERLA